MLTANAALIAALLAGPPAAMADGFPMDPASSVQSPDLEQCCPCGMTAPETLLFLKRQEDLGWTDAVFEGGVAEVGCADQGDLIDVLVLCTSAALVKAGSMEALSRDIRFSMALANTALRRSGLSLGMRLVGLELIEGTESGNMALDLVRLRTAGDGHFDAAHALRDQHGADLVALRVGSGQYCGVAFIGTFPADPAKAFSVLQCGGAVPAHEWGHNLGACHALGDDNGVGYCDVLGGAFSFSRGWRFPTPGGTLHRTIMAYAPGIRILSFSSPDVPWLGVPSGDAALADNALTLALMASGVAAFRPATFVDCDGDGVDDACAILDGLVADCNGNWIPDSCDLATGGSRDLDCDGVPDECAVLATTFAIPLEGLREDDEAGSAVALLSCSSTPIDGDLLVLGIPGHDSPHDDCGQVQVWHRDPAAKDAWSLTQVLQAPQPEALDRFGSNLVLVASAGRSGDPNWTPALLVGKVPARALPGTVGTGGAELYRMLDGAFRHEATFALDEPGSVSFGSALAMGQGMIAVAAPLGTVPSEAGPIWSAGFVQIYRRSERGWVAWQRLHPPPPIEQDGFGSALAFMETPDGPLLLVGAPREDLPIANAGAVFVYALDDGGRPGVKADPWSLVQTIVSPKPEAFGFFGSSLAVSAERVAIGAPEEQVLPSGDGTVHLFERTRDGLLPQAALVPAGLPAVEESASSVALACSPSGSAVLAGAPGDSSYGSDSGAVIVHRQVGGGWLPITLLAQRPMESARFGAATAIAGSTVAIGAPGLPGPDGQARSGGVFIVSLPQITLGDGDGVPDACRRTPDLDGDGSVGENDLLLLLSLWGSCRACPADLDGNGVVDAADLGLLLAAWSGR